MQWIKLKATRCDELEGDYLNKKSNKEVKTQQDRAKLAFHYVFAPFPLHDNEQRGAAVTGQFFSPFTTFNPNTPNPLTFHQTQYNKTLTQP
ncbi:hypothetical protein F383_19513 [Gossypium arboreum]|uniref:Uncharacterized protein n=1 Tax=Gossypium arboreum TaxID=29729 RepID=A0A0B0NMD7_GOSAR|nr:hypothetical protein F383_19513 [Gossypium arboreum]